ncbi:nucleotidyltransferase domain-containing protein [Candidatus Micrarchaeota archaeon]|nr:nucleotidyltransferase domain-containing protein [Candidatus Micrarchaeota archaeon]
MAEISAPGAWRILKLFESHGLITRVRTGKTDAWKLQPEHVLALVLRDALLIEKTLVPKIGQFIQDQCQGVQIEKITLFGSVAKGLERPDSDIDVLIVVAAEEDKQKTIGCLADAGLKPYALFGNRLAPIVLTGEEYRKKKETEFHKKIQKEGIILYERG